MNTTLPTAPPELRSACQLLAIVQAHRAVPRPQHACDVRDYCSGCFGILNALMEDSRALERFGRFALDLCEEHGSLTATQAKRERRTMAGRRRAASAAIHLLTHFLDAFELSGGTGIPARACTAATVH